MACYPMQINKHVQDNYIKYKVLRNKEEARVANPESLALYDVVVMATDGFQGISPRRANVRASTTH